MVSITIVWTDGSVAACAADIDRYIRENQAALASDYSPEYMAKVKQRQQKEERASIFADLILLVLILVFTHIHNNHLSSIAEAP